MSVRGRRGKRSGRSWLRRPSGWLLAGVALVAFVGLMAWPQLQAAMGTTQSGPAAPDVRMTTIDGQTFRLSDLQGKVVLVNFWATWCPPCRAEMPGFQAVYDRRKDDGFVVLGLSADRGSADVVRTFIRHAGITYPIGVADASVMTAFGNMSGLPTSFLIDRRGRIRQQVAGVFPQAALEKAVDRLLSESAPERTASAAGDPGLRAP